jgi:membrane fusion protein (multidrug efflux system)
MRTSPRFLIALALLAGAAVAVGAGCAARGSGDDSGESPSATIAEADADGAADPTADPSGAPASRDETAPLPVTGVVVERAPFVLTMRATGRAEAVRRAELALPVAGRIDSVSVRAGDRVAAGRPLVAVDPRPFGIARDEARARVSNAETDFRIRLFADSALTDERRLRVEHQSGLTEARAQLSRAELDLEGTTLVAPFAGEVAEVGAVVGALARREEPVITLVALDPIRIRTDVLESDFGRLDTGAAVVVTFPAFGEEAFRGTVDALGPEIDPERGTGVAWVSLPNPGGRIKPGMFADVAIAGSVHEGRLSVPRPALLERDRRLLVFKASGGRAEWQYVTTGLETRERIEIVDGLAPGDTVLVDGHLTLAHAAPVKVTLEKD